MGVLIIGAGLLIHQQHSFTPAAHNTKQSGDRTGSRYGRFLCAKIL